MIAALRRILGKFITAVLRSSKRPIGHENTAIIGRVLLRAEIMGLGDNPRFVVTSLPNPAPELLYRDLYGARSARELHQGDQERPRQRPQLRPRLPRQPPAPVLRLRVIRVSARRANPGVIAAKRRPLLCILRCA